MSDSMIHASQFRKGRAAVSGALMIEVLITLIIIAVGFFGIAQLILRSTQYTAHAEQNTLATLAASDVSERLWLVAANRQPGDCSTQGLGLQISQNEINHPLAAFLPGSALVLESRGNDCQVTVSWEQARGIFPAGDELIYRFPLPTGGQP